MYVIVNLKTNEIATEAPTMAQAREILRVCEPGKYGIKLKADHKPRY